ncbi:MAG: YceI family protein [Planctomycetota bacterium]
MSPIRIFLATGAIAGVIFASSFASPAVVVRPVAADAYKIDAVHSSVVFKAKHQNVSWGFGRFNDISGTITYDEAKPESSKVDLTIKTESVDTANGKRDGHLKSPDFFDAKQFPTATFVSKSVKSKDKKLAVTGDLTIRGVTKSITIDVEVTGVAKDGQGGELAGFYTEFTIQRTDFGVNYGQGGIGTDVTLMIGIEAAK